MARQLRTQPTPYLDQGRARIPGKYRCTLMEHKDRLDEFLQRKFAEGETANRFAFREEHWLQAQALIEAAERRRRRHLWWWLTGGTALALALIIWMATCNRAPWNNVDGRHTAAAPLAPVSKTGTKHQTAASGEGSQQAAENMKERAEDRNIADRKSAPVPAGRLQERPIATVPPAELSAAPAAGPAAGQVANAGSAAAPAASTESTVRTMPVSGPAVPPEPLLRDLELLPLRVVSPLPPERGTPPIPAGKTPVAETKKYRNWRLQAGILAAGASNSGVLHGEKNGFAAGLTVRLQRKASPWSFNADLLWRWRRGWAYPNESTTATAEQLKYSFGYTLDRIEQTMTGGHWLEMPVYTQFDWRTFQAEAGIAPALLLFAQGKETHTRHSSLDSPDGRSDTRAVRLPNRYFEQFGLGLFAGMGWRASDRLSLALRLHYQPGSLLLAPADQPLPSARPLWVDLRVRLFLFNAN